MNYLSQNCEKLPTWYEWLNDFYPSRVRGDAKRLSDTKRESDMPVSLKESAMVRNLT